ncbi:laccase-12 [Cinnamomum micranthum f. kanehirae]|uniref:Laccase n=1 Tax=Cinnamomum micranthum f. kanehirae TaxID=337451 RepID=A0A3S3P274_9MAGN|nr:laccase-12 [Cinnamomum micranthum f. kanehirae]
MEANYTVRPWCSYFLPGLCLLFAITVSMAHAEVQYRDFIVQERPVKRLCKTHNIITVNGQFPGPTLEVRNGDTLVINVVNRAQYNVTLHWHGIRQLRTAWADGPAYITQCPIRPGGRYTYRFTIEDQEGTLWWHAHSSWLRATVYGALIIHPKLNTPYPFPKPKQEVPIILGNKSSYFFQEKKGEGVFIGKIPFRLYKDKKDLQNSMLTNDVREMNGDIHAHAGEWWNSNPIDVINRALITGAAPKISNAYTINSQPGDLYKCSSSETVIIPVDSGETYLLRIINAAMNQELFFSIAGHQMTVVSADAVYTKPFTTSVLLITPGQTTDVLLTANQPPGRYYMAARAYANAQGVAFDNTTTTAILQYKSASRSKSKPLLPRLPGFNDTRLATAFTNKFKSPSKVSVPAHVDVNLFFTIGLGLFNCPRGRRCRGPNGGRLTASMNNVSLVSPSKASVLEAYYKGIPGVYTTDFPPIPPLQFDYTAANISRSLWQPARGTKVFKVKYGSTVQIVFQDTNIVAAENHPMHLHGYHFYVLANGFGNFNPRTDTAKFNLVDPPQRNTIGVPINGWTAIRFVADNPGAWLMHCHFDVHLTWGLSMILLVENGVGELQSLEPPPADLPKC